ncbi:hypothetical protein AC1031_018634 [Aphanomyces cochlioides]|nr:hypothetical protein AC1031_018634 [Aphanomyces cochlioides]
MWRVGAWQRVVRSRKGFLQRYASSKTIKSADDYFLPNLYRKPDTEVSEAMSTVEYEKFLEQDIQVLDAELESFFGPLQEKPDADDEERRPEPQMTPFTPTVKFELLNRDNTRERIIEQKFTGSAAPQVLILNGPCALVNDFVSGTKQSWHALQNILEQQAAQEGASLDIESSNHEGILIDRLLAAHHPNTTIVLNCGGLLHAYPGIQKAIELSTASVILLNERPVDLKNVRQLSGFGANGYELALHAATIQGNNYS